MAVLRVTRFLLLALLCIVVVGSYASAADSASSPKTPTKAYSPFDEPRPKIPQEIIDDKRLDMKVKVFCKSKNMKQLFADLSEKTGVKITANRELWGERPIIYFHNRPLRDVMTEISGLYGYRWLIGGNPGANEYEMFEDIRHAQRRDDVKKLVKSQQDSLLLDVAEKCMSDDSVVDRLTASDDGYEMFAPVLKDTSKLFAQIGRDFLSDVLANGDVRCKVSDLPLEWQQAVCDWRNAGVEGEKARQQEPGQELQGMKPVTVSEMSSSSFEVLRTASPSGMPRFYLQVMTPTAEGGSSGSCFSWPFNRASEGDAYAVTGQEAPKKLLSSVPLPAAPKINVEKLRMLGFRRALLLGDVLEAIARQSGMDVVADYYMRNESMPAIKAVPFGQAVEKVCDSFLYTCQVEKRTLRFRFNQWFSEPILIEPPAGVIERLWASIEKNGRLDISDMVGLAPLSDEELKWAGFKLLPGNYEIADRGSTLRLWTSLSPEDESQARTEAGLPVSRMSSVQRSRLDAWIADRKIEVSGDDLERSCIIITTGRVDSGSSEYGTLVSLILRIPGGTRRPLRCYYFPPPLKPEDRMELIAQRKADAKADVIELVK